MAETGKPKFEYEIPEAAKSPRKWDASKLILDRDFLFVWISQISTIFGGTILGISVGLLAGSGEFVDQGVNTSGSAMGLVLFFNNFPSFFVAFIAGVVADWFDKRKIMIVSNFSRMAFLGIFIIFGGWNFVAFAYAIIFLKAIAKQFFLPAEAALIPSIVKRENIMMANSYFNLTNYVVTIIGFIIAAPLLSLFGANGLMILLMFMFVIASISIFFVRSPKARQSRDISVVKLVDLVKEFYFSFRDGLKYITKQKVQRVILIQNLVAQSFVFVFLALIFKLGEFLIGLTPNNIGVLSVLPIGIGLVFGVLLINTKMKGWKRMKLTLLGVWAQGIAFTILSIASMLRWNDIELLGLGNGQLVTLITAIATIIIGFGFPFIFIPSQALMQEETEEGFMGRVYGVWFALSQALASIPAVIIGYLADYVVGVPTTLVWMSIIIFAYSLFVYNNRNLA
ncbi:MFS transporter [Candidatus Dojkabacteria bacterium]|nr:MFS transporter [Candidatus Dojkabacteria bacterium]